MESISRANLTDELRSGGKILRRRRAPATTPYLRPTSSCLPPPSSSQTPSSIFRFLASGAGKLLSSVFRSGSSSSSSSDDDSNDDEDEDNGKIFFHSNEVKKLNQDERTPVLDNDHIVITQQISRKSEAKLAIEKLLLQETFSREECTRLVKIIQSRVVDCPTMKVGELTKAQKELHERTAGGGIASLQPWRSLSETRKSSISFPYSDDGLRALSPGGSALQPHGLNLHNAAIMEAKKWIEEKKLESTSNSSLDHGPCTLNTAMVLHVTEDGVASPIDMAKSYMRARPPWASPSLSDSGFRTPTPTGMHLHMDETPYAMASHSLLSSKVLKRDSSAVGSWGNIEEGRRVRIKLTDDRLEPVAFKQVDSLAKRLDHEAKQTSSEVDKREVVGVIHDSNSIPAAMPEDASKNLAAEIDVDGGCKDVVPCLEKATDANNPVTSSGVNGMDQLIPSITAVSEETITAEDPQDGIPISATSLSVTIQSGPENDVLASNPTIPDKSKVMEEALPMKDQVGRPYLSHESLTPNSVPVEHNVVLNTEPEVLPSKEVKHAVQSVVDGVTNPDDARASGMKMSSEPNTLQPHQLCGLKETDPTIGSRSDVGDDRVREETNGLGSGFDTNGFLSFESSLSLGLNDGDLGLRSSDTTGSISISLGDGKLSDNQPRETCELLTEEAVDVPGINEMSSVVDGLQNGTSEKPDEQPGIQPQRMLRALKRGKKAGGYYRRIRGRGK